MKLKLLLIASAALLSASLSQAQFISLERTASFPISQNVTLTQPGPLTIIWSGLIQDNPQFTVVLSIDGATVDTFTLAGNTGLIYRSRPYRSAVLSAGPHSVSATILSINPTSNVTLLTIAENETAAGVETALAQLRADFQAADADLQTVLIEQMSAIQDALQQQITNLEERVFDPEGDSLVNTINNLQNEVTDIQGELDSFRQIQIQTLTNTIHQFQTVNLSSNPPVTQTLSIVNNQPAVVLPRQRGLKTSDYLIMGGSAAGATALGVGIYSIVDDDGANTDKKSTEPLPKTTARPGYHEKK